MEKISIRRYADHIKVGVTRKVGEVSVHWMVRVVGPTPDLVAEAIRTCRGQLDMLAEGVELATTTNPGAGR